MTATTFTNGQLKAIVDRIENLETEKKEIGVSIKEVYAEATGHGFDSKIIRKIIALRKKDANELEEERAMMELYMSNLGMLPLEQEIEASKERETV